MIKGKENRKKRKHTCSAGCDRSEERERKRERALESVKYTKENLE